MTAAGSTPWAGGVSRDARTASIRGSSCGDVRSAAGVVHVTSCAWRRSLRGIGRAGGPQALEGQGQEPPGVGSNGQRGRWPTGETGLEVDVDDALVCGRHRVPERCRLGEARADGHDEIGRQETLAHDGWRGIAGHPEVQPMVVADHVGPAPGSHDRRLGRLGEGGQRGGNTRAVIVAVPALVGIQRIGSIEGPAQPHSGAGDDDGRPCTGHGLQDGVDLQRRWLRPVREAGLDDQGTGDRRIENILGQRDEHRPRASRAGQLDHAGRLRRQAIGVVDLDRGLAQRAEGGHLVDLLERLVTAVGAWDLPDERDQRGGVLACRVQRDGQVGGPDRSGRHGHGGAAGQLAVGLGHEARATLVARRDGPDRGIVERVEDTQEALAGDGERVPDAGRGQRLDDRAAAGRGGVAACRPVTIRHRRMVGRRLSSRHGRR